MTPVRDYYDVDVPGDLSDDLEVLGQQAIVEAEQRTRIFAIPATWTATRVSGEIGDFNVRFQVRRKRWRN